MIHGSDQATICEIVLQVETAFWIYISGCALAMLLGALEMITAAIVTGCRAQESEEEIEQDKVWSVGGPSCL